MIIICRERHAVGPASRTTDLYTGCLEQNVRLVSFLSLSLFLSSYLSRVRSLFFFLSFSLSPFLSRSDSSFSLPLVVSTVSLEIGSNVMIIPVLRPRIRSFRGIRISFKSQSTPRRYRSGIIRPVRVTFKDASLYR